MSWCRDEERDAGIGGDEEQLDLVLKLRPEWNFSLILFIPFGVIIFNCSLWWLLYVAISEGSSTARKKNTHRRLWLFIIDNKLVDAFWGTWRLPLTERKPFFTKKGFGKAVKVRNVYWTLSRVSWLFQKHKYIYIYFFLKKEKVKVNSFICFQTKVINMSLA